MAKKASPKKSPARKTTKPQPVQHHENVIQRLAEEVEARFLEGAEMATETTSAETNLALAALGAIEGPREPKPKSEGEPAHGKRKSPTVRPKKR
jgi:hypothetical protein